jgi:hypothetical protein
MSEVHPEDEAGDDAEGDCEKGLFHDCSLLAARKASHASLCATLAAFRAALWGYEGDAAASISLVNAYSASAVRWYSARAWSYLVMMFLGWLLRCLLVMSRSDVNVHQI